MAFEKFKLSTLALAVALTGCLDTSDDDDNNEDQLVVPATYSFDSELIAGDSSVSYSGQATRHLLINELKYLIGSDELQGQTDKATALAMLNAIYKLGTTDESGNLTISNIYTGGQEATPINLTILTDGATMSMTDFSDVSGDKSLYSKIAGQDNDMTNDSFVGWTVTVPADMTEQDKPNLLIESWFDQIATLATDGDADTTYVTAEGLDLKQLVQKFLLGAVTYSQAAEDYLKADKGLVKQNSAEDKEGKPYTSLEHQWDEGFGYFGAARDYNNYSDADNKSQQDNDTDGDGVIDLYAEYSYGNSVNAAKRDAGATDAVDFSKAAMDAFLTGRQIIVNNIGEDPVAGEGYHAEIVEQATIAMNNWENAIAATVVHYVNDVLADMNNFGTADYSFSDHAKHWGEMKGFALGLQFSPIAQISIADLTEAHNLMGEAPVLETATDQEIANYKTDLEAVKTLFQNAYGFTADNVANW